jgi:hypothetical protein
MFKGFEARRKARGGRNRRETGAAAKHSKRKEKPVRVDKHLNRPTRDFELNHPVIVR